MDGDLEQQNGIPILEETFKLYPRKLQVAWDVFDAWWQLNFRNDGPRNKAMPPEVAAAKTMIETAPIPGYGEATGAKSRYMLNVNAELSRP
jgi:hypothetical protein